MIDLLVIGAGPVGLSAAIAGAQRGWHVEVVDPRQGTIDKACGEGLMPATLDHLDHLGVRPARRFPFRGIRYIRGDTIARGTFRREAAGVRRTVLHQALEARLHALGIPRHVHRARQITQDDDAVIVDHLRARWVIAADGIRSPTRHTLGLDRPPRARKRYGLRRHFHVRPWSDTVDVHWADDVEAYVTPVDDELVGVALLFDDRAKTRDGTRPFDRLLRRFPTLQERLTDPATTARGAGPFVAQSSRRHAGRVFLAGDAAGYIDPLTGEGLKVGIGSAIAAVHAIASGKPASYERDWRALYRPYAWTTRGLLMLTAIRPIRRSLPSILARTPRLFDRVLRLIAE